MSLDLFLFAALPGGLVVAGLLAMPFRIGSVEVPRRRPPATILRAWAQTAVAWSIGLGLAGLALGVLAPGLVAGWGSSLPRRILLEGSAVAVGVWFLGGLMVLLYEFAADDHRPPVSVADGLAVAGVFVLALTGVVTALAYRWASLWGSEVASGWLRGMLTGSVRPEEISTLPVAARLHLLALAVVVAVFPHTRWMGWVRRGALALRRAWADLVRPPSPRPAGVWLRWGPAWARAVVVVLYFVAATVVLPSIVVERIGGGLPSGAADAVTAGVWLVFLAGGIAGLRALQRRARL